MLLLALAAQTPVKATPVQSVPAYTLAKLSASNATAPLEWKVYQLTPVGSYSSGGDFVFTAPPGTYLVALQAANGTSTWQIQFTAPGNLPNPGPGPSPSPAPIPSPIPFPPQPGPTTDPSGFVYPPELSGFTSAVSDALKSGPAYSAEDAASLSTLYSLIARQIQIDGQRGKPGLKTVDQATAFVKSAETAVLQGMTAGKLTELKGAFPEVAKVAAAEFATKVGSGSLTPRARAGYVEFLQLLASGFEQAITTGKQSAMTPPRPAPQ